MSLPVSKGRSCGNQVGAADRDLVAARESQQGLRVTLYQLARVGKRDPVRPMNLYPEIAERRHHIREASRHSPGTGGREYVNIAARGLEKHEVFADLTGQLVDDRRSRFNDRRVIMRRRLNVATVRSGSGALLAMDPSVGNSVLSPHGLVRHRVPNVARRGGEGGGRR